MDWIYNDGGRAAAGIRGKGRDCVARAIAIAHPMPYRDALAAVTAAAAHERPRSGRKRSSARTGVAKPTVRRVMADLGWTWHPTMTIGSGCTVHLDPDELPGGRLIVSVSTHLTVVIDGVVHDDRDPRRGGRRCVYGYWYR